MSPSLEPPFHPGDLVQHKQYSVGEVIEHRIGSGVFRVWFPFLQKSIEIPTADLILVKKPKTAILPDYIWKKGE